MVWYVIVVAVFFLLWIILRMKITIYIDLKHTGDNDDFKIKIKTFFNLITYKVKVPVAKLDKESPGIVMKEEQKVGKQKEKSVQKGKKKLTPSGLVQSLKKGKEFLNHVVGFHIILRKFLSNVIVKELSWESSFGTGDAAQTGMLSGVIWSIKGSILGILSNYMILKTTPKINVVPAFQQKLTHTHLKCIISFRVGHAIGAALRIVKYWKHQVKGGKQHVGTSNSGFNDNGYGKYKAND